MEKVLSSSSIMDSYEVADIPKRPKELRNMTPRELDSLACIVHGKTSKGISPLLSIACSTASSHTRDVKYKLQFTGHKNSIVDQVISLEARAYLSKVFNNLLYIHGSFRDFLRSLGRSPKNKNAPKKKISIYHIGKTDNYVALYLEMHMKDLGFETKVSQINHKVEVDKDWVKVYACSGDKYAQEKRILNYDYVVNVGSVGYVTSLLNFLKRYYKEEVIEEERKRHFKAIFNGVSLDLNPEQRAEFLDITESIRTAAKLSESEGINKKIQETTEKSKGLDYNPIGWLVGVHNKMKAKHKLLPWTVYAVFSAVTTYALYPKPENSVVLEQNLKIAEDILINRDDLLNQINNELSSKDSKIVALIGAGGAGKTTLARVFLNSQKEKNQDKIVFELNAETEESLYSSLSDMCYRLVKTDQDTKEWGLIQKASNQKEKNQSLVKFARRKLSEASKWLLVFDNTEELDNVTRIVPSAGSLYKNGRVLLTTRNQNIKSVKTMKSKELRCIDVGELSDQEKYKLFTLVISKLSDKKYAQDEVEKFLEKIPNYPLDIVSVACYLASSTITLQEYDSKMKEMGNHFNNEVKKELMSEVTSYGKTRYGIVAVTLEKILQDLKNEEIYKDLLLLISICDSQNIPIKLLEKCSSEDEVKLLLQKLKKHSFIEFGKDSISIHRSIQEIWLQIMKSKVNEDSMQHFLDIFFTKIIDIKEINHMCYKMNIIQSNRTWYAILLPHITSMAKKLENINVAANRQSAKFLSMLLYTSAQLNEKRGEGMDIVFKTYKKALDIDDELRVLDSYQRAVLLCNAGRALSYINIEDGIKLSKESLDLAYNLTDAEPLIVMNLQRIASAVIRNGNYDEGIQCLNKAISEIPNTEEIWAKKLYIQVKYLIEKFKLFQYVNNKEIAEDVIKETLRLLKMMNTDHFLHIDSKRPKEISAYTPLLKRNLIMAYNALENYKLAEKTYKDSKFIYDNFPTSISVFMEATTEYGRTLLRIDNLSSAKTLLTDSLKEMQKLHMPMYAQIVGTSCLSEVEIRLNKYKEALKILSFIKDVSKLNENRDRLNYTDCLYNAAFASYKLDKADDAKKYFSMFIKNIHELCGTLISEDTRKRLESEGAFSEQENIKMYLMNAYKIYAAIFGKNHAFVKDYIGKNVQDSVPVDKVETPAAIGA